MGFQPSQVVCQGTRTPGGTEEHLRLVGWKQPKGSLIRTWREVLEKALEKQLTCLPGCVGGSGSEYEECVPVHYW